MPPLARRRLCRSLCFAIADRHRRSSCGGDRRLRRRGPGDSRCCSSSTESCRRCSAASGAVGGLPRLRHCPEPPQAPVLPPGQTFRHHRSIRRGDGRVLVYK